MKIAWNWIGIAAWILIGLYFCWIVIYLHYSSRKFLKKDGKRTSIVKYVVSIALRIILLVALISGMLFLHFHRDNSSQNVLIKKYYEPMVLDTNGEHSYYVNVQDRRNPLNPQLYSYLTNGHREYVPSSKAVIYADKVGKLPLVYETSTAKVKKLDLRYQKAWTIRITVKYKHNWLNGLSLRSGSVASRSILIRVPNNTFIHNQK